MSRTFSAMHNAARTGMKALALTVTPRGLEGGFWSALSDLSRQSLHAEKRVPGALNAPESRTAFGPDASRLSACAPLPIDR
jgi:hypothetical protein